VTPITSPLRRLAHAALVEEIRLGRAADARRWSAPAYDFTFLPERPGAIVLMAFEQVVLRNENALRTEQELRDVQTFIESLNEAGLRPLACKLGEEGVGDLARVHALTTHGAT
jgi:hypothetical protein